MKETKKEFLSRIDDMDTSLERVREVASMMYDTKNLVERALLNKAYPKKKIKLNPQDRRGV